MNDELEPSRKETGVFWVEVEKIVPNSVQPRREFDEAALKELSDSIRQYGVLQPLVVFRCEKEVETGTFVNYELIAGERRWRASKMAGLLQVPVIVREEPTEKVKLELALIENLQREDLSPLEKAEAFKQLADNFRMKHAEIGSKLGKSRVYVTNTIRLLGLPDEIKEGLRAGLINEGHTRPLMGLAVLKDDQIALYKEIIYRKMSVREAEEAGRRIIREKNIKKVKDEREDPESRLIQQKISDVLGTKVFVEKHGKKKKVSIEFFSDEELGSFLSKIGAGIIPSQIQQAVVATPERGEPSPRSEEPKEGPRVEAQLVSIEQILDVRPENPPVEEKPAELPVKEQDVLKSQTEEIEEDTSWLKNFSL